MSLENNELYAKWDEFLQDWPVQNVETMTLELYSKAGNSNNTFTGWLEAGTGKIGSIWGGSSFKFGVYSRDDATHKDCTNTHMYTKEYGWLKKYGLTPQEAFEQVKCEILKVISYIKSGNIQEIDKVNLGDAYKWKIAFLYQDRKKPKVINVFKKEMLQTKFGSLNTMSELNGAAMTYINGSDLLSYGRSIWTSYGDVKHLRIWKVSHGINDVSKEEHDNFIKTRRVTAHSKTKKSQEKNFIEKAKIGDLIYLTRSNERVELLGQIISEAKGSNDGWIFRDIKVLKESIKDESYSGIKKAWTPNYNSTFSSVKKEDFKDFEDTILKPYFDKELTDLLQLEEVELLKSKDATSLGGNEKSGMNSLNQILYGPPGTGKTYNTVLEAVKICEPDFSSGYDEAQVLYKKLKEEGRIEFITFHQSYGYEEFIEGIRAETTEDKNGNSSISYDVTPGVFKRICQRSENIYFEVGDSIGSYKVSRLSEDLLWLSRPNAEASIPVPRMYIDRLIQLVKGGSLDIESIKTKDVFNKVDNEEFNKYILNGFANIYYQLVEYFIQKEYLKYQEKLNFSKSAKPYVLIIDEINRGNMSKIFGELITLIEDDKRIGASNEMTVRLPVSGDEFGVPKNLHIIGTMNTADRSIAMMDTALRRRFEFKEMMPNPELLKDIRVKNTDIDVQEMLSVINQRIEVLYDREHTVGHAYFMSLGNDASIKDLASIFENKVIPLLAEYFFEDWGKIRMVLGDNQKKHADYEFIKIKNNVDYKKLLGNVDDADFLEDRKVFERSASALEKPESYVGIYDVISMAEIQVDSSS